MLAQLADKWNGRVIFRIIKKELDVRVSIADSFGKARLFWF